jgi:hypothetical protein
MKDEDYFFVHKVCGLNTRQLTKIELAVLLDRWDVGIVQKNLKQIPEATDKQLNACKRQGLLLALKAQLAKESTDKFSEGIKALVYYNRGIYLVRTYALVGQEYFKLEVTKVACGARKYLSKRAVLGLKRLLLTLIKGHDRDLFSLHLHKDDYTPLNQFLDKLGQ